MESIPIPVKYKSFVCFYSEMNSGICLVIQESLAVLIHVFKNVLPVFGPQYNGMDILVCTLQCAKKSGAYFAKRKNSGSRFE